jgi:hypothetical protein
VNQIPVTVQTFFFIPGPWIENRAMRQHGSPFIGQIEEIAMAFPALGILNGGVRLFTTLDPIIGLRPFFEMDENVLQPMQCLGIEKIEGIMGRGQVAVHAISHKPLSIIHMRGSLPGIVSRLDFVTGGTKPGRGRADHGVIGETEERKGDEDTNQHP